MRLSYGMVAGARRKGIARRLCGNVGTRGQADFVAHEATPTMPSGTTRARQEPKRASAAVPTPSRRGYLLCGEHERRNRRRRVRRRPDCGDDFGHKLGGRVRDVGARRDRRHRGVDLRDELG